MGVDLTSWRWLHFETQVAGVTGNIHGELTDDNRSSHFDFQLVLQPRVHVARFAVVRIQKFVWSHICCSKQTLAWLLRNQYHSVYTSIAVHALQLLGSNSWVQSEIGSQVPVFVGFAGRSERVLSLSLICRKIHTEKWLRQKTKQMSAPILWRPVDLGSKRFFCKLPSTLLDIPSGVGPSISAIAIITW